MNNIKRPMESLSSTTLSNLRTCHRDSSLCQLLVSDDDPYPAKHGLHSSTVNASAQPLKQRPVGEFHKIVAHVQQIKTDPDINDMDTNIHNLKSTQTRTEFNVSLKCELGDMWQYRHQIPKRRSRSIRTGEQFTDKAIEHLDLQGFTMQYRISYGRNVLIMAHSTFHSRMIAIKFIITNVHRTIRVKPKCNWQATVPNEIIIHEAIKHRNIVEYIEYQHIEGCICLLLEYCGNGSLSAMLDGMPRDILSEDVARKYLFDILDGLTYLHNSGVAHRDIRCENLLLDTYNHIKICDFGSARKWQIGDKLLGDRPGTEGYMAPEVVTGVPHQPFTIDIWSTGCVLYKMVFGELPYRLDRTEGECPEMNPTERDDCSVVVSYTLRLLLRGMLHPTSKQRYTLNRIRHNEWTCQQTQGTVSLGAFYNVCDPQRCKDSSIEQQLKEELNI